MTPLAECLLFTAARAEHVEKVIAPALDASKIVICDRFTASTVAYQGYGRGVDLALIHRLNNAATLGLQPDLTVLLDMPADQGLARKRANSRDVFESEALEFHRKVREGYLALAASAPGRWLVVDGAQSRRTLADQIWTGVQPLLT